MERQDGPRYYRDRASSSFSRAANERLESMERALSGPLAKRMVVTDTSGRSRLVDMTALELVQGVRAGGGTHTPKAEQRTDVTILDIFRNASVVKIDAGAWIDYLQVAKWNGRWVIVNVLWELRPRQ